MTGRSNEEWLESLRGSGREEALAELRGLLIRGLRRALAAWPAISDQDVEDFVQEALLKILDSLDSFRGESRFTTWASRIAVNIAFSELRRRRWRDFSLQDLIAQYEESDPSSVALADPEANPSMHVTQRMLLATIERVIAEDLTDRQREALTAVMMAGMSLPEVARRMGTNRNALYKLLHDARCRLKDRLLAIGLSPDDILSAFSTN